MNTNPLPLRAYHLPAEISWWPPAPGWWIVAALLLLLLAVLIWWQYKRRRSLRLHGLRMLHEIRTQWQADHNDLHMLQAVSALLRRIAISRFPRSQAAALNGEAWLHFLDETLDHNKSHAFSQGLGEIMADAAYRPAVEVDGKALLKLAERWINRISRLHRKK
ncbi:MAG: DUF4381 domain-containing protein [gamma proteobacterium symbiont of Bathyaustriella thionipta]|nr:DUF4381 domain-containing protein [gamma proteobacterium symbiont of Bathyaustriella thionipta]